MFVGSGTRRPGRPNRGASWCVITLVAAFVGMGAAPQPALAAGHAPKPRPASVEPGHPVPAEQAPATKAKPSPSGSAGLAPLSSRAPASATAERRTASRAALCEAVQRAALADPVMPVLSGSFLTSPVFDHQESMLVLTLTGPDNCSAAVTGMAYTVNLPSGAIVGDSTPGAGCGATIAVTPGGTTIGVTNAVIPINTLSCALQVPVTATAAATYTVTAPWS
jgi:hypothetical protein